MKLATRIRYGLARILLKATNLTFISPWIKTSFLIPSFERLVSEGYTKNSVVTACISVLTFAYPEPPLLVWDAEGPDGEALPDHPLRKLIRAPNPIMGEDELWQYTMAYAAIGGNAYWLVGLNGAGQPVEIWPYHAGQIRPVPGGPQWIRGYEFYNESNTWEAIDPKQYIVVHFKWPLPDMQQPWLAQPPLRSVAAAVDVDTELDRYLYALLKNDAIPRGIISLPGLMDPGGKARMREQWKQRFGEDNRGDIAILDDGASYQRVSLNLEELAFDALRNVPETRIAAAFRTPPIIVGLLVGLEHGTYSNYEQARKALTQDTFVPLWRAWSAEVQAALGSAWGKPVVTHHDLTEVASLQEDVNAQWSRVNTAFMSGYVGFYEARRAIGYGDPDKRELFWTSNTGALTMGTMLLQQPDQLSVTSAAKTTPILGYHIESGVVSRNEARAQLGLPPEDQSSDDMLRRLQSLLAVAAAAVNVGIDTPSALALVGLDPSLAGSVPPALPPPKALGGPSGSKASAARIARSLQRIRAATARRMEPALDDAFTALAGRVVARAEALKGYAPHTNGNGHGHAVAVKELPGIEALILDDDFLYLDKAIKRYTIELISASWETWNTALSVDVAFELTDPAVTVALASAAKRVTGIGDTTRDAIRDLLTYGSEQGWTIGQLVAGDETQPGLRDVVEATYKGRAQAIARTETAMAQQEAAVARFDAAGLSHVVVFDGGSDDSDDACNALNGTRQTLGWAEQNPIGHPRCTRCFAPAFD